MRGKKWIALCASLLVAAMASFMLAQETRFHQFSRKAKGSCGNVKLLVASCFGTSSVEEFVDALFLSDGTIVLLGNAWGAEFPKVDGLAIIGEDNPTDAQALLIDGKGAKRINYANPNIAAFLLWLSGDGRKVIRAVRFGWGNADGAYIAASSNDAIYISGKCTENFRRWLKASNISHDIITPPDGEGKGRDLYLAHFSSDGRLQWVLIFERAEGGIGPESRVGGRVGIRCYPLRTGELVLSAYNRIYVMGKERKLKEVCRTSGVLLTVDEDRRLAFIAGDRNTHTGREPWRQPFCYVISIDDGTEVKRLWTWEPKTVGDGKYRLVSDSGFKAMIVTREGDLAVAGWSDGGNSVFLRQPTNLDEPVKYGFIDSLWGARVGRFSWLMRVELKSWQFKSGTNWCAFLTGQNRPNSADIDELCELGDGRIAFIGGTAHNVIETPDAWSGNYLRGGSGDHFGIFSGDFNELLFCSRMPDCDLVSLACSGKMVVVVGRTFGEGSGCHCETCGQLTLLIRNPIQEKFGGAADAYFALIDAGQLDYR
ncbi:MAG: hypothetical protein RMK18_12280 [Armatimonadota bacterium]|nr:hypothetical protein [Armatimonadota bacterium]MDW8026623.1 hypothetical protein [Armatimonadota bacterium]